MLITEYPDEFGGPTWNFAISETQVLPLVDGETAQLITANTPRNLRLATGSNFIDTVKTLRTTVSFNGEPVDFSAISTEGTPFNVPYYDSGTITQLSKDISDRQIPVPTGLPGAASRSS